MYLVEQGFADKTPIPEVLRTRKPVTIEQKTITGQNLSASAIPNLNAEGEINFIVVSFFNINELLSVRKQVKNMELDIERYRLEIENLKKLNQKTNYFNNDFGFLVNDTDSLNNFTDKMKRISKTNATVLLLGESGTGKTHLAHEIHKNSQRGDKQFISINCSTISPNLFESELFGYSPGAFTGAGAKGKNGLVALADGGTLFLDEVGDIPLMLQVKLLELIQEKRYLPVGALRYKFVDLKIIAATNRDLKRMVESGEFREDLYYRLKVVEFFIPPLRERPENIKQFLIYFLNYYNNEYGYKKYFNKKTSAILKEYQWPGNIRELQNLVHNVVIMSANDEIIPEDIPKHLNSEHLNNELYELTGDFELILEAYKKKIVEKNFKLSGSSRKMASILNISQTKSTKLIKKYIEGH